MLASHGVRVLGTDIVPEIVDSINRGDVHIEEPGLEDLVRAGVASGRLRAATKPEPSDVFIIAVPTPIHEDKTADLRAVRSAAEAVLSVLKKGDLVVLESTSPPGTTQNVVRPILERSGLIAGKDFSLAYSPERVLPGRIIQELASNDRVVGGIDEDSSRRAKEVYATFVEGEIITTTATTAEMVKLMENTFRDVNIALANELALIAEKLGVDAWEAIRLANHHPRVNILQPGPGVGGHCIAVDPWFFVETAQAEAKLISTARKINDAMPDHVSSLVERALEGKKGVVACLGLTFKADVDDVRESPALHIAVGLRDQGYVVRAYDPMLRVSQVPNIDMFETWEEALQGAEVLLLLVNHAKFASLEPAVAARAMAGRKVVDTRGMLPRATWEAAGFDVVALGATSSARAAYSESPR